MCVVLIFTFGDTVLHADNYLRSDRLVTPRHIVPEWYYLAWYAVLRCSAWKLIGVMLLFVSILFFFALSGATLGCRSSASLSEAIDACSSASLWLALSFLGVCPPCYPFIEGSAWAVTCWFLIISIWYFDDGNLTFLNMWSLLFPGNGTIRRADLRFYFTSFGVTFFFIGL